MTPLDLGEVPVPMFELTVILPTLRCTGVRLLASGRRRSRAVSPAHGSNEALAKREVPATSTSIL